MRSTNKNRKIRKEGSAGGKRGVEMLAGKRLPVGKEEMKNSAGGKRRRGRRKGPLGEGRNARRDKRK